MKAQNLLGLTFGRLTVVKFIGKINTHRMWLCRCQCGNEIKANVGNLKSGQILSCKCLSRENFIKRVTKHGYARKKSREYSSWKNMRNRCNNKHNPRWMDYGGRGIGICERWDNFHNFREDMGPVPDGRRWMIERKDNDPGYTPENCCWALALQQSCNKRNNHFLTHDGVTQHLAAWARQLKMNHVKIIKRLNRGWSVEKALTAP